MGDLSPHFSRSEFVDHWDGSLVGPSQRLLAILEHIRDEVGQPLVIVSGYRTKAHQKAVHPGVLGFHPLGRAADLRQGVCTVEQAVRAGAGGIGVRGGWVVHVDDRKVRRPVIFRD